MRLLYSAAERVFFNLSFHLSAKLSRAWMPHYPYMFSPAELAFLVSCVDRVRRVPGCMLEVGCMRGRTTVFLNRHMDCAGIDKAYICVDTFSGFTARDVTYEIRNRGKDPAFDWAGFANNKQLWFDRGMQLNGLSRVRSIKADVVEYDFSCISADGVAFCLIDVDLYQPVKATLERVYPRLASGGVMIIDDCKRGGAYDGALDAYSEFCHRHGLTERIVCDKLGIIEGRAL